MNDFTPLKAELKLSRKEYITPHYIRIYLKGEKVPLFTNSTIGVNNKILIPPELIKFIFLNLITKKDNGIQCQKKFNLLFVPIRIEELI